MAQKSLPQAAQGRSECTLRFADRDVDEEQHKANQRAGVTGRVSAVVTAHEQFTSHTNFAMKASC